MKKSSPTPAEIKAARTLAGLSQTEAAELIHSTMQAWQQWEYVGPDPQRFRHMHPAFMELFLIKTGQVTPVVLRRSEKRKVKPRLIKGASEASTKRMMMKIEAMPKANSRDIQRYHRTRWLFMLMHYTGLSLVKISKLTMVEASALAQNSPALAEEMKLYRKAIGVPAEVDDNDFSPALRSLSDDKVFMTRAGLHLIIHPILDR